MVLKLAYLAWRGIFGAGMNIALSLVISYLLGSIPFAYIIGRINGTDIRQIGDRNVGAFNVFRHVGFGPGFVTVILDIIKGAAAILVARAFNVDEIVVFLTGVSVVAGHNWPVFLRFRGGRGEATIIGVLFALVPIQITITFAIAIIVLFATHNSILVGAILFVPVPFLCLLSHFFFQQPSVGTIVYTVLLPCLSGITHWFTTRHLPPDAKKESETFWIANQKND
jgi:glycerol-3-phosphate acyltransferase PlsY